MLLLANGCRTNFQAAALSLDVNRLLNIVDFLQICFRLCDKFLPEEPILSEENHLIVHFYSDAISRFDGFFATYEVIRKCKIQLFQLKFVKFVENIKNNTQLLSEI